MGWARKKSKLTTVPAGTRISLREPDPSHPGSTSSTHAKSSAHPKPARPSSPIYTGSPYVAPSYANSAPSAPPPQLARRRQNRKSTIKSGRTIGEQREHLETASERQAKHKKNQRQRHFRIIFVTITFVIAAVCVVALYLYFTHRNETASLVETTTAETFEPTVQIIDEDGAVAGGKISQRTKNYVGQAEVDFRDFGYTVDKAVIPTGAIREIDFYLKNQPGFVKMHLDRPTAESIEDADRLLRYLKQQGTTTFEYLDVRLPQKAFWK